jgi:hypothetical protein
MTNANVTTSTTALAQAQNGADEIIPGTTWTYGDAASMAKECAREDRLFGRRNRKSISRKPSLNSAQRAARYAAKFLQDTGMTLETAASMAKDAMRHRRLFDGPAMYVSC